MLILGFSGGPDPAYPSSDPVNDPRFIHDTFICHDSAAVLVQDGKVVAAIEEERLNRIKHTNKSATNAIKFCLSAGGADLDDVDQFVYYGAEQNLDLMLARYARNNPAVKTFWTARTLLAEMFRRDFGKEVSQDKISFVEHHLAHAMSAYALSKFDTSLVMTIDGQGDGLSGTVFVGNQGELERLADIPGNNSIGYFYTEIIGFLGYTLFDEYKVMGLAPYGDPSRFRDEFKKLYTLNPDGSYAVHRNKIDTLSRIVRPRRKGETFTTDDKDLAAALQESLETIVFHHVSNYQKQTGQKRLCLAGGVAHNCTMNGKLLRSGLFTDVFVQPASHDAGCALGAALYAFNRACPEKTIDPLTHLYWGTDVGTNTHIAQALEKWRGLVEFSKMKDTAGTVAGLLANGSVVGWVQGRSEFGPRALGNRSILADPRPSENRRIINAMVKKREGYRPFAPSVLAEHAHEYFEVPAGNNFPHMVFVVNVREEMRSLLGAVTHVDGTARIQTVSKEDNPRYWNVISAFRDITGIPIVLNTSFNNNVEPIIDSVADALSCFLTTRLDYLVVGDYLVSKRAIESAALLEMTLSLPLYVQLANERQYVREHGLAESYACKNTARPEYSLKISRPIYNLLSQADGQSSLRQLISRNGNPKAVDLETLIKDIEELWCRRLVILEPGS